MKSRKIYLLIFLFICSLVFPQTTSSDNDLLSSPKTIKHLKKDGVNAITLVNRLIKGKLNDQEKFDAIFSWVVLNIKYDYSEFYLPTASVPNSITRILKTKRTICLGYSNLMDSLCKVAGIKNITIYGYAKDNFFDVNDTIYIHNHAWNSVKLDGLWYLYDATWSKGQIEYKLTLLGRLVTRWFEKHAPKYKRKKFRNEFEGTMKQFCGFKNDNPVYYYKPRILNRWLRYLISRIPIRFYKTFVKGITKDYYLSEPRIFGITHIPDNPIWGLGNYEKIRSLETDSAYYYFNDSILKSQTREGKECAECDNYAASNTKEQLKDLSFRSKTFNNNNEFIIIHCESLLGNINRSQAITEKDSLKQMQFLDSAQTNFANAQISLRKCRNNMKAFFSMHKTKNKHKMNLLLKENKGHTFFISEKIKLSLKHARNFSIMLSQGLAYAHIYKKKAHRTRNFKINIKTDKLKPYSEPILNVIKNNINKKETLLDSVINHIRIKKQSYDSLMLNMSLNIWQQIKYHDSINTPFEKTIGLRKRFKDNYKKIVIDIRKTIPVYERRYSNNLNSIIYEPATKASILFKDIVKLIKAKTKLQNELLKYNRELLKAKELSYNDLKQYRDNIISDSKYDFCWIAGNISKIGSINYGFEFLKEKQQEVLELIIIENSIERHRHYEVLRSLKLGYKTANKDINLKLKDNKISIKNLRIYRKALLKKR